MAEKKLNREAWLHRMAEMLRPWFREHGYVIHGRITVSMAAMKSDLGLCTHQRFDKDKMMHHIFVNVYEDSSHADPVLVAETLCHELIHSILPVGTKHGKEFKAACAKLGLGLTPKGRGHTFPLPELRAHLELLVAGLPPLPRHGIARPPKIVRVGGSNGTFKFQCAGCKTTVYLKYTSLNRAGTPTCWNIECDGVGDPMVEQVKAVT